MKYCFLFSIVLALSSSLGYAQCDPTTLIIDPSFEIGGPTFEEGCSTTPEDPCVWQVNDGGEIVSGIAYDGDYSWKTNGGSATQEPIALSPNTTYALSCWVNTATTAPYGIAIRSTTQTFATGEWQGPTDGWEKIAVAFTTGTDNLTATVELACHTSTAYFDLFELCEGILDIESATFLNEISFYPNPSNGAVFINSDKFIDDKKIHIKVFNLIGEIIYEEENISLDNYQLNLGDTAGMYFIEVNTETIKRSFKLIKI